MSESSNPWDKLRCAKCCDRLEMHFVVYNHQKYHDRCFACATCRQPITDKQHGLNKEKKPICLSCHENSKYENSKFCYQCSMKIMEGPFVTAHDKHYHPNCFTCVICSQLIEGKAVFDDCNNVGHPDCLIEKKYCFGCDKALEFNQTYAKQGDNLWHKECFKCKCCTKPIPSNHPFYPTGEFKDIAICIDCGERNL